MRTWTRAVYAGVLGAALQAPAIAGETEPPKSAKPLPQAEKQHADAARKKPLQRCDELTGQPQLDCLQKAREKIVDARNKRETVGAKAEGKSAPPGNDKKAK